jgi:hypothetical protein
MAANPAEILVAQAENDIAVLRANNLLPSSIRRF